MKAFLEEFKKFITRGNVMDMAVGIIIGGAFTAIVNSLVDNIIMPLISAMRGSGENAVVLGLGTFLAAVVNFLLITLVLFCVLKALNKASEMRDKLLHKEAVEEAPKTKICPYCKSEIPVDATRCPHCTSVLEEEAKS